MKRIAWAGLSVMFVQGIVACGSPSGDAQAAACDALAACCTSLSGGVANTCEATLSTPGVSQATCAAALQTLENDGVCATAGSDGGGGGGGGAGSGGGGSGEAGGSVGEGGSGCAALAACCPQLPVDAVPTECLAVAMEGTSEACTFSLNDYAKLGYCGHAFALEDSDSMAMPMVCPSAGQILVSVMTDEDHPICDATVTASQGEKTWDLMPLPPLGQRPCSYVGDAGELGTEVRISAQAPGYAPGSSTASGGQCDFLSIVLDPGS